MYANSQHCMQCLHEVQAIDYFSATALIEELVVDELVADEELAVKADQSLLFHCFIALSQSLREGSSCLPLSALAHQHCWAAPEKAGYQFADLAQLQQALASLAIDESASASIVLDNDALYLRRYWQFEQEVAQQLAAGFNDQSFALMAEQQQRAQQILTELFPSPSSSEEQQDHAEIDWQAIAVANALSQQFSVISGGPGTGKTYTVTKLLMAMQLLHNNQLTIKLAAPTGKAAQRMKESIAANIQQLQTQLDVQVTLPKDALTLHRLLGIGRNPVSPKYHQQRPIDCDVLVVDEVSMVDLPMMARLLRALPAQAQLVLIGDAKQLPSVEVGNIMADISRIPHEGYSAAKAMQIANLLVAPSLAEKIQASDSADNHGADNKHTKADYFNLLHKTHRQQQSDNPHTISRLASFVIQNAADEGWALLQSANADVDLTVGSQISQFAASELYSHLQQLVSRYYVPIAKAADIYQALGLLKQFRLLMANREGEIGVEAINLKVQQMLGVQQQRYYRGRPIMVSENDYANGLFNGDIGLIWPDPQHPQKLCAWFEVNNDVKPIALSRLPKVETVYAMTIHKTQGSEFEHVAILLPNVESKVQSKELLYTGITRAKKQLTIIADENHWQSVFKQSSARYSGLAKALFKLSS
ncbi:exodeoxyribonuclease V subunit alpha [Alteromonadaceae bacterium BrNp21-10]|nr:exodeoxyribonuclease V subunit alpha [Alteromonadaceae bacterium BrNp21-10]